MCVPDRITHTTAFVTPVLEHWLEPRGIDPTTYHTMSERSYHDKNRMPTILQIFLSYHTMSERSYHDKNRMPTILQIFSNSEAFILEGFQPSLFDLRCLGDEEVPLVSARVVYLPGIAHGYVVLRIWRDSS